MNRSDLHAYQRLYMHLRTRHRVSIAVLSGCRSLADLRSVHAASMSSTSPCKETK